jgi:hypothetical protein
VDLGDELARISDDHRARQAVDERRWGKRVVIREDQNTKEQLDQTTGGSRIATSVGGPLLGIGADIVCIDDPTILRMLNPKRSARTCSSEPLDMGTPARSVQDAFITK